MNSLGIDYAKKIREDARLIILKALAEQINESLASNILQDFVLPRFAIRQDRAWVHSQIDFLANLGAVTATAEGTVKVVSLTTMGQRHLDRDIAIEGVTRPSRPGE
ncbi:VpaChn25_0724 family phage protein [Brucella pseudogrignonensis]|uniref:VpaChn25_0724 family phage protein n=1 Tax=Brucella pseudogrignonensis TaxID=419475 RepID=UPI003ECC64AA